MSKKETNYFIVEEIELITFREYENNKFLLFKKTCHGCPCQYDIYENFDSKEPKYYGRLRWGYFYVAREPDGKPLYEHRFEDGWKGAFDSSSEEIKYLKEACKAIWFNKKKKRMKK